ncbi:hypothetical protein [Halotalea alkalilenta]|uniref:Uncharacterized protein n=1 Tax=Halotalea alkalilenta TaxID=376489 RepID=A0A172YCL1_9GAMM|nr:hypothetical protein [Halotalea alkalilenta]ANF56989.1 hypothetical protein A5892_05510 [Halotalea alkalilenta]
MTSIARWRVGALPGCRWEPFDPLFWPRWLWAVAVGGGFFLALALSGALWVAPGLEALFASRATLDRALEQRLGNQAALERLTLLRGQEQQLARYRQALNEAFAVPARPLEALSSLALERGLEITRLAPLGDGSRPQLELSLEGDFVPLVAFMLAPSALGAVSLGDFELRRALDTEEDGAARLALRLELGWHPDAEPGPTQ